MGFLETEDDYIRSLKKAKKGIFPVKELLILVLVMALGVGVFYITGYTPKAKVDNKEYVVTINTYDDYRVQIVSIVNQLCSEENNFNTKEKYKILHDFVAKAISYDYKSIRPGVDLRYGQGPNDPKKALNTGLGVCGAYAQLYKDLCDEAGLTCAFVYGRAFIPGNTSSLGHAWNAVNIDGKWYHTDCCWSDTGGGLYDYYMRGERFIQVGDGGNFREMYSGGIAISDTDYKFDRSQPYANIVIKRQ